VIVTARNAPPMMPMIGQIASRKERPPPLANAAVN
jgi:hypothetical protein